MFLDPLRFTFAYEEFTDATLSLSRYFVYLGDQFVVDTSEVLLIIPCILFVDYLILLQNLVYAFFPYNISRQCETFSLSTQDSDTFLPTYQLLDIFNFLSDYYVSMYYYLFHSLDLSSNIL